MATGIQSMLNILESWYIKWSMSVNTKNTNSSFHTLIPITDFHFMPGDVQLTVSDRYRYLGLELTEYLDCDTTASIVAQSACMALSSSIWGSVI